MASAEYMKKLRDPKWQRKRLEIMKRDEFRCQICGDDSSTLNVHHRWYVWGNDPWDYPDYAFATLCESCHETETDQAKETEHDLLRVLQYRGFFSGDFYLLTCGFLRMAMPYPPDVMSSILESSLADDRIINLLAAHYFKKLERRRKQAEDKKEEKAQESSPPPKAPGKAKKGRK